MEVRVKYGFGPACRAAISLGEPNALELILESSCRHAFKQPGDIISASLAKSSACRSWMSLDQVLQDQSSRCISTQYAYLPFDQIDHVSAI